MTFTLWITGLPCSGKTSISKKLSEVISNLVVLDGDEIRKKISLDDFSDEGISENNKRIAHDAKSLMDEKNPVCVSLVSPRSLDREKAKKIIGSSSFIELYLKCSASTCESRDVKGMYKKARMGQIKNFLGIDGRYEVPEKPDLVVDTENTSIDDCVQKIINYLKIKNFTVTV